MAEGIRGFPPNGTYFERPSWHKGVVTCRMGLVISFLTNNLREWSLTRMGFVIDLMDGSLEGFRAACLVPPWAVVPDIRSG